MQFTSHAAVTHADIYMLRVFSQSFFPYDPQAKDQGGYLHPAHPCVNHPHLKMKVTNKLPLLFIFSCLSHLFHVNLSVSHYSYIMLLPPPHPASIAQISSFVSPHWQMSFNPPGPPPPLTKFCKNNKVYCTGFSPTTYSTNIKKRF